MLTSINLKNYKAFEDATIPIKPITILLGANSVGKSSIIQLLLMLQQTGRAGLKSYKSALKLYGGYVNLGDAKNLFRKKDISKPLQITFELKSKVIKDFLKTDYFEAFIKLFHELPIYIPLKGFSGIRNKPIKDEEDFKNYLDALIDVLSKDTTRVDFTKEIKWFLRHRYELFIPTINKANKLQFTSTYEFLSMLSKAIKNENFQISYDLKYNNKKNLEIQKFEIIHNNVKLLSFINETEISVTSDLFKLNSDDLALIKNLYESENTIFNSFKQLTNLKDLEIPLKGSVVI